MKSKIDVNDIRVDSRLDGYDEKRPRNLSIATDALWIVVS